MTSRFRRLFACLFLAAGTFFLFAAGSAVTFAGGNDPFAPENELKADGGNGEAPKGKDAPKPPAPAKAESPPKKKFENSADHVKIEASASPAKVRRGEPFWLVIKGAPSRGWHTYPLTKQTANPNAAQSELYLDPVTGVVPLRAVEETEPKLASGAIGKYYKQDGPFTWKQKVLVTEEAKPGKHVLKGRAKVMACDADMCLPAVAIPFEVTVDVSDDAAVPLTAQLQQELADADRLPVIHEDGDDSGADGGLLGFIFMGVFWGFVSLITPCVFPMIPITVSYFLKQSEKEHHRPLTMAAVYCGTIIVVLTIAAVALLSFFRELSTNPIMNFVIGGLFIFFALSLFGMYEIELPSGLARFTSSREGQGGLLGTMFMALTFTIISFACVAPFLGGFGGTAANSNLTWTHRVLGGLAFAVTFASPFFVLALFPALLKKMPKSGSWLNTVKVVMGFLELAAALKFLRAGELVIFAEPVVLTYDFVLALYVGIAALCGLYLLGVYRLPHDSPPEGLSVPRMLIGLMFLVLGFYLLPGIFKFGDEGRSMRPSGDVFAWFDSFILPDEESDIQFMGNLDEALAKARAEKKLVFVDFTGVTCNNCKLNEREIFPKEEVREVMAEYVLVALYTDKVPRKLYGKEERRAGLSLAKQKEDAVKNLQFQRDAFNTEQLPLYVILEPQDNGGFRTISTYPEGRISSSYRFARWLSRPQEAYQKLLASRRARDAAKQAGGVVPGQPAGNGGKPAPKPADPVKPPESKDLPTLTSLDSGLKAARDGKKLVFVDFTGVKCPPCKINKITVFTRPEVKDLLARYQLVTLYTDEVPLSYYPGDAKANGITPERRLEDAKANLKVLTEQFKHESGSIPVYVIVEPGADGKFKELRRFDEGRINDPEAFVRFLQEPLKAASVAAQAGRPAAP